MVRFCDGSVRARALAGRGIAALALLAGVAGTLDAQVVAPIARVSMTDAVRLTLERNQSLRAQRLTIDQAKADETTAALKPNFNVSFGVGGFNVSSPSQNNWDFFRDTAAYTSGLAYTFERGGKRARRTTVAEETTEITRQNVVDQERQVRFEAEQAFIAALLARSTLELARENLESFSQVVDVNRQRVASGDLAQGDFYKVSLQLLQFEQDVSAAEVGLVQAKAALRQLMGFDTVADDFEIDGTLGFEAHALDLESLKRQALENRPDVLAAHEGVTHAEHVVALETANRARDVTGELDYVHVGPSNTLGATVSFDLPFRDRNQGNIARSEIGVRQAVEAEAATRFAAVTDVVNAFAAFETNRKILTLYQSGYLDQARKSLEITKYVYQRGAGTVLDFLDAERTYRATELAYRQALASYMTSVRQLDFAVGKQVIP